MVRTVVGQERPEAAPGPVFTLWLVVLPLPPPLLLLEPLDDAEAVCGAAIEADGGDDVGRLDVIHRRDVAQRLRADHGVNDTALGRRRCSCSRGLRCAGAAGC